MAQLLDNDILQRIFSGDISTKDALVALIDRETGRILPPEGDLLDYKRELNLEQPGAVAELARDIFYDVVANTNANFLMTLGPTSNDYDGNTVTESSPVTGVNACYWSGLPGGTAQHYPQVAGSTWTVGVSPYDQDQYGLDTVGFPYQTVNLIQTQGPANGVDLPCRVDIYQLMTYDGVDPYVGNLLTISVGPNTVQDCRATVCSNPIQF